MNLKAILIPNTDLKTTSTRASIGLLALRLIIGIALVLHGSGKITSPFSWMGPDAPVPGILQALAALSEFGGGLSMIIGLLTPLSSLGIIATMAVAVNVHASKGDGFIQGFELAAVYLVIALTVLLVGPGKYSIDSIIAKKLYKSN
ncbi:MAG: DoxX family protein [Bdellovibrio sp.]|nr:DoxX family protein [Bdellovibrio sp.]